MSYHALMKEQTRSVFDAAIATKILQHITRVRDSSHSGQARRWVWELIQNAKDTAYPQQAVRIKIQLFENRLVFSHNGKAFGVKNLLSIINQVSSKSPDNEETTGKFGTGFVTTHLLSEKVELTSLIQDQVGDTLLPFKSFSVLLDRSGTCQEEILAGVDRALNVIEDLDSTPDVVPDPDAFNTSFTYFLDTQRSKDIARGGLEDLEFSVFYALAFVEKIHEIIIEDHTTHHSRTMLKTKEEKGDNPEISTLTLTETVDGKEQLHHFMMGRRDKLMIATPVTGNKEFLPMDENTPRIFADFPLIGSETFPVPVVCNSSEFQPDEPRSFIPIVDNEVSVNSNKNKEILQEAMVVYGALLEEASAKGYQRFYHVATYLNPPSRPDLDKIWVQSHLFDKMGELQERVPMIFTQEGLVPFSKALRFPMSSDGEERQRIWQCLQHLEGVQLPLPEELSGWYDAFCRSPFGDTGCFVTLEMLANQVSQLPRKEGSSLLALTQEVYHSVLIHPSLRKDLTSGTLALFPDQSEEMTLRNCQEIYEDVGLDRGIKEAIVWLNPISYTNKPHVTYDIYGMLIHKDFDVEGLTGLRSAPVERFLTFFQEKTDLKSRFRGGTKTNFPQQRLMSSIELASCYEDKAWFDLATRYFPEETQGIEYAPSTFSTPQSWRGALLYLMEEVGEKIQNCVSLDKFTQTYFEEEGEDVALAHLVAFRKLGGELSKVLYAAKIFPNQNNLFCTVNELHFDKELDPVLKEVAGLFSSLNVPDYGNTLLRKEFGIFEATYSQIITNQMLSSVLTQSINVLLNRGSLSSATEEVQEGCTLLLAWIQDHEDVAESLFSSFFSEENRMKLLTTKSASIMHKKVKETKDLLERYGLDTLEALDQRLTALQDWEMTQVEDEEEEEPTWFTTFDVDIDFDLIPEADGWSMGEKEDYAQKVGLAGESMALDYLRDEWLEQGYEVESFDGNTYVLTEGENQVTLYYPDCDNYRQEGWDIKETVNQDLPHYYEVKSSVNRERVKEMNLTYAQTENAFSLGARFTVISMFLDTGLEICKEIRCYSDIPMAIQQKSVRMPRQRMTLYRGAETL